ncbi:hypothetical protein ACLB2K_044907 [Fragaria x ananassa]
MEEEKIRYLQHYLRGRERPAEEYYSSKIKNQEARLRSCYSETIEFSSDELVRIILVDAAFIIEILLRYYFPELQDENDYILKEPHLLQAVSCDLGLLENQLPFFLLEDLFDPNIINCVGTERPSIVSLSYHFFKILMHMEGTCQTTLERLHCSGSKDHFVNLLRNVYLPLELQSGGKIKTLPGMTELQKDGVKFKVGSSKNLFDIRFLNGVLEIPKIVIGSETEYIVRNIIAYEQCHCHITENYMSNYVVFMDRLVNTAQEVEFLVKKGIVENVVINKLAADGVIVDATFANHQGSTLIKKLVEGVIMDPNNFYFGKLCENLNEYCISSRNCKKRIAFVVLFLLMVAQLVQMIR